MKTLTTVPAHFDGKEIKLDVPVELEANARLLVTILNDPEQGHDLLTQYAMISSERTFHRIWDNDEDAIYDSL